MKTKLFITLVVLFSAATYGHSQQIKPINSKEVTAMFQKDKKLVVLDVRTADEFKAGHIKGAINIDIRQPDALSKIDKLDHHAKYIVHCRTNHRSKVAAEHMAQNGFKNVYQMMDGFNGWSQNNLPIEK